MKQSDGKKIAQIFIEIARLLYKDIGPEDMSSSLSAILNFDKEQRVSRFENLAIDGLPKIPSFKVTEEINNIAAQIKTLPKKYLLKQLKIAVEPGGKVNTQAVYLNDN